MWVFLNDAFLSVVADRNNPRNVLVRARVEGDIERCFITSVEYTPKGDYHYRASVPREQMIALLRTRVDQIDYPNFKMSVTDEERHFAYIDVWTAMHIYQRREQTRRAVHRRWKWRRRRHAKR